MIDRKHRYNPFDKLHASLPLLDKMAVLRLLHYNNILPESHPGISGNSSGVHSEERR